MAIWPTYRISFIYNSLPKGSLFVFSNSCHVLIYPRARRQIGHKERPMTCRAWSDILPAARGSPPLGHFTSGTEEAVYSELIQKVLWRSQPETLDMIKHTKVVAIHIHSLETPLTFSFASLFALWCPVEAAAGMGFRHPVTWSFPGEQQ